MRLLLVNGGLRGAVGDTAAVLTHVARAASAASAAGSDVDVDIDDLVLADYTGDVDALIDRVKRADAAIFASGTVWSGPSSVMARFLEVLTPHELADGILGKPAGVVVTMDSVGGMETASRLASALLLLGFTLPPCSLVALARRTLPPQRAPGVVVYTEPAPADDADTFSLADLPILVDNVLAAAAARVSYRAWPVRPARPVTGAYPTVGPLDFGLPRVVVAE